MTKTKSSLVPVGYTHSQFLIGIDVDKVCDDHYDAKCMKGRCEVCSWEAAYICPTKALRYNRCLTTRQRVEGDLPKPPTPPPTRKISNGKPLTEDTHTSSVKGWLLPDNYSTSLIFFIGGCIVGTLFATVFN